jgi:hypothetical protein
MKSIQHIHNCINNGTDLNGWKKVEWRGSVGAGAMTQPVISANKHNSNSRNNFFVNRHSNATRDHTTTQHVFGNKYKADGSHRNTQENITSIPLTSQSGAANTTTTSNSVIATPSPLQPTNNCQDTFRPAIQKYVSKFKKSSDKVEDTILNTIILGKLNKFSEQNYDEIKEFITHIIDSGQTDMIKCFMKLVFEKAASEEIFCPLYAKLLSELSSRYPVLLTEMTALYNEYMEIFEEIPENDAQNYNEVCKRNIEKKYRRGYSQFLAELIKYDVIDISTFIKIISKIIQQVESNKNKKELIKLNEEYADCFMKIMKAINNNSDSFTRNSEIKNIRKTLKNDILNNIRELTVRSDSNIGLSNKARFTFLDIYEKMESF